MMNYDFINALVYLADEEGSDATIIQLRTSALNKMLANGGKELVSANLNNKSFNYSISMSANDLFTHCQEAIRIYNEEGTTSTMGDFSYM